MRTIAILLLTALTAAAQGPWTASSLTLDSVTISNWVAAAQTANASDRPTQYFKAHNTNNITFATADTWEDITFNFLPPDENSFGITLSTNDNKTISFDFNGHLQINGCVRPYYTGTAAGNALCASRIIWTTNSWATTNEARCLQSIEIRNRQADEMGVMAYHGSLTAMTNMQVRLQVQVDNTVLELEGWTGFDNPTSASINIFCVGRKEEEEE